MLFHFSFDDDVKDTVLNLSFLEAENLLFLKAGLLNSYFIFLRNLFGDD